MHKVQTFFIWNLSPWKISHKIYRFTVWVCRPYFRLERVLHYRQRYLLCPGAKIRELGNYPF